MSVSTYNAIGTITLSSTADTVTFSNIPQIYTDLVLVYSANGTPGGFDAYMKFNGDSTTKYNVSALWGNGSTTGSLKEGAQPSFLIDYYGAVPPNSGSAFSTMIMNIIGYTNPATFKNFISQSTNAASGIDLYTGFFGVLQPLNSITLISGSGNDWNTGCTFSLYGLGANQLKASGGDTIVTDGTYWYHAFKSSGTFTPNSALSCDVLVVAGGGGGSTGNWGGGSGAGGLRSATGLSISTATTVTVGAGGAPVTNGSDSIFLSTTSSGGGYGGSGGGLGTAGGSGGGASGYASAGAGAISSPVTSPVQGYAGGRSGYNGGNGGGGAGGVGLGSPSTPNEAGAAGGVGSAAFSSWAIPLSIGRDGYLAGGGGGAGGGGSDTGGVGFPGLGGLGGGGVGANGGVKGGDGAQNTGGGAGGTWGGTGPAIGGSGVVIVRYAI